MIVELRRNMHVIVPKRIAYKLGLEEGDRLHVRTQDGVVALSAAERTYEDGERIMIVELRRNLQIIIPRQIANDLDLQIGDLFDVVEEDGVIKLIPVVVYTKAEAARLERLASEGRTPGHASGASFASAASASATESEPAADAEEPRPALSEPCL